MERSTPVRKPHTSTADLLTWPEKPLAESSPSDSAASGTRPAIRSHQPSDEISKVLFGEQVTDEEAESLSKRKPCSDYKLKEITGSLIFGVDDENGALESGISNQAPNKTAVRIYQQALSGISQISFGAEESVSPKKPTSLPEVAKQRELSGTLESESDMLLKKQLSDAKCKELSGHDIFGPPPEFKPRPLAARALELRGSIDLGEPAPRSVHTSVKVSNPAGGQTNITLGGDGETAIKTAKKNYTRYQFP